MRSVYNNFRVAFQKIDAVRMVFFAGIVLVLALFNSDAKAQASPKYYWYYHIVDRAKPTGTFTTLLYDRRGFPNISYCSVEGRDLKFARFDGVAWQIAKVDPASRGRAKMTLDAMGLPHIVYGADDESKIMLASYDGTSWAIRTIDSTSRRGQAFYDRSIQVDEAGRIHICYGIDHDAGQSFLIQMTYAFVDGDSSSAHQAIDNAGHNGKWNSMALDAQGRPATAYYATSLGDPAFAYLDQDGWKVEYIAPDGFILDAGIYSFIKSDGEGNFFVTFQNHTAKKLQLAYGHAGSWTVRDIADLHGWTTYSTPNPLCLDQNGNPYIAFTELQSGDLKLAYEIDNAWHIETVDSIGNVGEHSSIAMTPEGMPAISYYDATNGYLRLAVASLTAPPDADGDTIPDYVELEIGTDIHDVDSDDDGLADGQEDLNHNGLIESGETDPRNLDTDSDGIQDGTENGITQGVSGGSGIRGTDDSIFIPDADPSSTTDNRVADTDEDGLSDGREDTNRNGAVDGDETDPNFADTDNDGLFDNIEASAGLSGIDLDSDDDGLVDGIEDGNHNGVLDADETDPKQADTDNDGLADGLELGITEPVADPDGPGRLKSTNVTTFHPDSDQASKTDPLRADTDIDGLKDGAEDTDKNGRFDAGETDPLLADTDGDFMKDGTEVALGIDPLDLDSDDDGLSDGAEDVNFNGKVDSGETSSSKFDTDDDGLSDGLESGRVAGLVDPDGSGPIEATASDAFVPDSDPSTTTNPTVWDSDGDFLSDGGEDANTNGKQDFDETNPLITDTDEDGFVDGDEVNFQSDPLVSESKPSIYPILTETFSDEKLTGWAIVDEGTIEGPSAWAALHQTLVQNNNIYGGLDHTGAEDPVKPGTYIWRGALDWRDYKLSFKIRSDDDDALGVMFRYRDRENYYRFSMDRQRNNATVVRAQQGVFTVLSSKPYQYESGRWYEMHVFAVGPHIQIYLDGERLFDISDSALDRGAVAFYSWRNAGSLFSNVRMLGTGTIVEVSAQVDELSSEIVNGGRLIRWQIANSAALHSVALIRIGRDGQHTQLFAQEYGDHSTLTDGRSQYLDNQPWLAKSYRLVLRNISGNALDAKDLTLNNEIIGEYSLSPGFPNPFERHAKFVLQTPTDATLRYRVYNIRGQLVLSDQEMRVAKGWHQVDWDGTDTKHRPVSTGVYFIHVEILKNNRTIMTLNRAIMKIRR